MGLLGSWDSSNISNGVILVLDIGLFHGSKIDHVFPLPALDCSNIGISPIGQISLVNFFYDIRGFRGVILPCVIEVLPDMIFSGTRKRDTKRSFSLFSASGSGLCRG